MPGSSSGTHGADRLLSEYLPTKFLQAPPSQTWRPGTLVLSGVLGTTAAGTRQFRTAGLQAGAQARHLMNRSSRAGAAAESLATAGRALLDGAELVVVPADAHAAVAAAFGRLNFMPLPAPFRAIGNRARLRLTAPGPHRHVALTQ